MKDPATARLRRTGVGLFAVVAVLAVLARAGRPFGGLDRAVLDAALDLRTGAGLDLARIVTDSGTSPVLFPLVAVAGIAVRVRTGRWRPGVAALVVAALGVLARFGLSQLVREPRPAEAVRAVAVGGFSFPSGHTVTSALVAGALAYLLHLLLRPTAARVAAVVLGLWAALVGLSRVYLGVHWLSDVVAGWLFAAALLTVLLLVAGPDPARHDPASHDLARHDPTGRDPHGRDPAEGDPAEGAMVEGDMVERDSAEPDPAGHHPAEGDMAERDSAERDLGRDRAGATAAGQPSRSVAT